MNTKNMTNNDFLFSGNLWKIYEHATRIIRKNLDDGQTYEQACKPLNDIDQNLKQFIMDDFLKILIAEEHFGTGVDIDDLALHLGLTYEKIESSRDDLIKDIVRETTEYICLSSSLTH